MTSVDDVISRSDVKFSNAFVAARGLNAIYPPRFGPSIIDPSNTIPIDCTYMYVPTVQYTLSLHGQVCASLLSDKETRRNMR